LVALALVSLALSIVAHRSVGRLMSAAAACAACFAYYVVMYEAHSLGLSGAMPTVLVAWLPNLVIVLISAALAMAIRRTPQAEPSALSAQP
jgi:lipopolysaccharide export LptBFGC system permease protein LptF